MRRQNQNRRSKTPAEAYVCSLLDDMRARYQFEKGLLTKKRFYLVDFYFPSPVKLCLEIDGGYHNEPEQRRKDERRDNFIRNKRKMRVVRITNEHAMSLTREQLANLISP
jgi:very-short-patch-repair endonuclease